MLLTTEIDINELLDQLVEAELLDTLIEYAEDEDYIDHKDVAYLLEQRSSADIVEILDDQYRFDLKEIFNLIGAELRKREGGGIKL